MSKNKKTSFKAGNVIRHSVESSNDVYELDYNGENRFVRKEITRHEETLLIIGFKDKSFILAPLGESIKVGYRRKYFHFGGFSNCFTMLASYVNTQCVLVS